VSAQTFPAPRVVNLTGIGAATGGGSGKLTLSGGLASVGRGSGGGSAMLSVSQPHREWRRLEDPRTWAEIFLPFFGLWATRWLSPLVVAALATLITLLIVLSRLA
jgi:hypothetical protein